MGPDKCVLCLLSGSFPLYSSDFIFSSVQFSSVPPLSPSISPSLSPSLIASAFPGDDLVTFFLTPWDKEIDYPAILLTPSSPPTSNPESNVSNPPPSLQIGGVERLPTGGLIVVTPEQGTDLFQRDYDGINWAGVDEGRPVQISIVP
eukprot:sb/3473784/